MKRVDCQNRTRQRLIGVLIGDVSFDFTAELMAGLVDAGKKANAQLLFLLGMQKYSSPFDLDAFKAVSASHNRIYDYSTMTGADAFIIACGSLSGFSGGVDQDFLSRFANSPTVILQERAEIDSRQKTYIVVDNYHSFSQCIEHLIVTHHFRKIALVSGPAGHADARERLHAYRDCMAKYHLAVPEDWVVYGDFSEYVDDLVSDLLDRNPDLEAIAFANDEMAKAGYRECRRRGLVVGRDIAITGFDNFNAGRTMEPPLTTVSQDTYEMGRLAVEQAMLLLDGKPVSPLEMRTEFLQRQSCGCRRRNYQCPASLSPADEADAIDAGIEEIQNSYVTHFPHSQRAERTAVVGGCFAILRRFALTAPEEAPEYNTLSGELDAYFTGFSQPLSLFGQCLEDYLLQLLGPRSLTPALRKFAAAVSYLLQYIHTRELKTLDSRLTTYGTQSWLAPELTRGLFSETSDEKVLHCLVKRLVNAGFSNVSLCLLENTPSADPSALFPVNLRLAAYASANGDRAFSPAERPIIDPAHPLRQLPCLMHAPATMAFSLFSGSRQYGILLCDADLEKSSLLHVISLQLGMLFDFLDLRRQERNIAVELESIREKNEILNFLSEYDPLCGLLNRRGFIERAIRSNRENIGKIAYCAFIDLDYLKQINDSFGHHEGDLALQGVSDILQRLARPGDLIGRIGGDEFVGLFLSEDPGFEAQLETRFHKICADYNTSEDKPYWLDISMGLTRFICRQGLEISTVIAEADQRLYEAKRRRRDVNLRLKRLV